MVYVVSAYICTILPLAGMLLYSIVKYKNTQKLLKTLEKVSQDEKLAG